MAPDRNPACYIDGLWVTEREALMLWALLGDWDTVAALRSGRFSTKEGNH